jgi:phenol hydroxylase P4 protein
MGRDNLDFESREDQKNFAEWRGQATKNRPIKQTPNNWRQDMAVAALKEIRISPADTQDKFHGAQLLYIGWEDHLLFCAPFAFPFPPTMRFGDIVAGADAGPSATTRTSPDRLGEGRVVQVRQALAADFDKSLAENGLKHKDVIRFRTPGPDRHQGLLQLIAPAATGARRAPLVPRTPAENAQERITHHELRTDH